MSPLLDSVEGNFDATGHCLFHRVHHESIIEDCNEIESVVDDTTGKEIYYASCRCFVKSITLYPLY